MAKFMYQNQAERLRIIEQGRFKYDAPFFDKARGVHRLTWGIGAGEQLTSCDREVGQKGNRNGAAETDRQPRQESLNAGVWATSSARARQVKAQRRCRG
jgi:hypothetical protein